MKKATFLFSLFASLVLISNSSFSQIRKIPSNATETLKQKYPTAESVEWKDQLSHYTAKFRLEDKDYEVHFDNKGDLKESLVKLDESEIPAPVKDGLEKSKYSDWAIDKVEKLESSDGKLQYRLQLKDGDIKKKIVYFTPEGKLAKDHITLWF